MDCDYSGQSAHGLKHGQAVLKCDEGGVEEPVLAVKGRAGPGGRDVLEARNEQIVCYENSRGEGAGQRQTFRRREYHLYGLLALRLQLFGKTTFHCCFPRRINSSIVC